MDPIYVTGHRNPDTDSIVSAMAYAQLRNALGDREYVAARLGRVNDETQLVLDRYGFEPPALIHNLRTQVSDLSFDTPPALNKAVTVDRAWQLLHRDENTVALPVVEDDGTLYGMLSTNTIAAHDMRSVLHPEIEDIPVFNLVSALEGSIVLDGKSPTNRVSGRVTIALPTGGEEAIQLTPQTVLLCGHQPEVIMDALRAGVPCVVVCQASVPEEVRQIETKCLVISTPHEPYRAARMIFQSLPVSRVCRTTSLCPARLTDYVDDVRQMAQDNRHRAFPVVDDDNKVVGTLSRIHLLKPRRKRVVLVDHNEVAQSVPGLEQAEILEIIDHHRLADVQTGSPIYMRNEPVGSTATIVAGMFMERGLMPTTRMAGLLTCAIISDTLMFKSPTCTPRDIQTAERMASIAHESIDELGRMIFSASTSDDKSPDDILFQDYKEFMISGHTLGVGQVVTLDSARVLTRADDFLAAMRARLAEKQLDMMLFMITDMLQEGTHLLFLGAPDVIAQAFNVRAEDHRAFLPGILSRKKQVIPSLSVFWG
ncbi:MAG: putative manganese-dependent inorganic diphosphatase [Clostridia bacterium]|nr:putative manganese-dependent inorganic diphosphatase [Clostridia bacterium]